MMLVVVSVLSLAGPVPTALAYPGEFLDAYDSNNVQPPKQYTINGKKRVRAHYDRIKLDCGAGMKNCEVQFRLAHKCTAWYCTWTEHTPTTVRSARSSGYTGGRCAGGYHYWKVQSRLKYDATESTTIREATYDEYGYSSEGSVGGRWRVFKFAAKDTYSLRGNWKTYRNRTVTELKRYYTQWQDEDQAAGTIYTSPC